MQSIHALVDIVVPFFFQPKQRRKFAFGEDSIAWGLVWNTNLAVVTLLTLKTNNNNDVILVIIMRVILIIIYIL